MHPFLKRTHAHTHTHSPVLFKYIKSGGSAVHATSTFMHEFTRATTKRRLEMTDPQRIAAEHNLTCKGWLFQQHNARRSKQVKEEAFLLVST